METRPPQQPRTAPVDLPGPGARHEAFVAAVAVGVGVATSYWVELVSYPPGSGSQLWFLVDGNWRYLDSPSAATLDSVQEALCECSDQLEVAVWYENDIIVGLVVRSK